jgi:hypothetical protein
VKVNAHRATSLDESVTNTIVFGSAKLLTAQVKAETNRQSLTDMVEAGLQGKALTLVDLAQTDRTVDVYMEDPASLWVAMYDAQGTPWDYELEARFRRTDGSAFPDWIVHQAYGTEGLLFKYVPGMDLSAATFTRATTATYVDIDGVTQTDGAAANVARDAHYQTVDSVWTRTLRLENDESETLYFDWAHLPQAQTVYAKWLSSDVTSGDMLFQVGGGGSGSRLAVYYNSTNQISATMWDASSNAVTSNATVGTLAADVVYEVAVQLYADASVQIHASADGGATASGSQTSAPAAGMPAAWGATIGLHIAGPNTWGAWDVMQICAAAGTHSLDHMRSLV